MKRAESQHQGPLRRNEFANGMSRRQDLGLKNLAIRVTITQCVGFCEMVPKEASRIEEGNKAKEGYPRFASVGEDHVVR